MASIFETILQPCSFEGVLFPITEADTTGGHDSVKHTALRRRGADVESTGQRPYSGKLTIPFINGLVGWPNDLFPNRRFDLLRVFESTPIGTLSHPTYGTFQIHVDSWHEKLDPNVRNGCYFDVEWTEHNAGASLLLSDDASVPQDAPTATTVAASTADAAMEAASPSGSWTPTTPIVEEQLAFLEEKTRTYAEITASLTVMVAVVETNLALAEFDGSSTTRFVEQHEAVVALESLRGSMLKLRSRYLPQAERQRIYTVPSTMALFEIAQLVYGDASKASLLLSANAIRDPLVVPGGTKLVVLP
jgi:prophage DNA circulation protein